MKLLHGVQVTRHSVMPMQVSSPKNSTGLRSEISMTLFLLHMRGTQATHRATTLKQRVRVGGRANQIKLLRREDHVVNGGPHQR